MNKFWAFKGTNKEFKKVLKFAESVADDISKLPVLPEDPEPPKKDDGWDWQLPEEYRY